MMRSPPDPGPPIAGAGEVSAAMMPRLSWVQVRAKGPRLLVDAVLPYGVYLVLYFVGVSVFLALCAGCGVAGIRIVVGLLSSGRFPVRAAIVLGVFLLGPVAALITRDARLLLLKEAATSALLGISSLGSLLARRPVMFYLWRSLAADAGGWDESWSARPALRRCCRVMSAGCGAAMLLDAIVRVLVVYGLALPTAATVATPLSMAVVACLIIWIQCYSRHADRQHRRKNIHPTREPT